MPDSIKSYMLSEIATDTHTDIKFFRNLPDAVSELENRLTKYKDTHAIINKPYDNRFKYIISSNFNKHVLEITPVISQTLQYAIIVSHSRVHIIKPGQDPIQHFKDAVMQFKNLYPMHHSFGLKNHNSPNIDVIFTNSEHQPAASASLRLGEFSN